jgi:S1-C subfamily serine protease
VVVQSVEQEAAARHAGLRRGDIIVEANRREVESLEDLEKALEKEEDRAVLLVQRGESTIYLAFAREPKQ